MKAIRGFSLVELIIGMLILSVLLALALPTFTDWLRNARVRTAAEAVLNGLQLARIEAVRRNAQVRFSLVNNLTKDCVLAPAGPSWVVSLDDPTNALPDKCATPPSDAIDPRIIQSRNGAEGSAATTVAAGQNVYVFNSLGRLTAQPARDEDNVIGGIKIKSAAGEPCKTPGGSEPVRCLRVVVLFGGQIRMCDPALPPADAQAC